MTTKLLKINKKYYDLCNILIEAGFDNTRNIIEHNNVFDYNYIVSVFVHNDTIAKIFSNGDIDKPIMTTEHKS